MPIWWRYRDIRRTHCLYYVPKVCRSWYRSILPISFEVVTHDVRLPQYQWSYPDEKWTPNITTKNYDHNKTKHNKTVRIFMGYTAVTRSMPGTLVVITDKADYRCFAAWTQGGAALRICHHTKREDSNVTQKEVRKSPGHLEWKYREILLMIITIIQSLWLYYLCMCKWTHPGVCSVTGKSWRILHSWLIEYSLRDCSLDLHNWIPARSGILLSDMNGQTFYTIPHLNHLRADAIC